MILVGAGLIMVIIISYIALHDSSDNRYNITQSPAGVVFPRIDGDRIVFESRPDWYNADICMMNATSGVIEPVITTEYNQYRPDISGDMIVWQDKRSGYWDIYSKNLTTGEVKAVCISQTRQTTPQISGDRVVFVDDRFGTSDIKLYNLSTGVEEIICQEDDIQWQPDIDGDWIVWEDWRCGADSSGDIFAYYIPTQQMIQVSDSPQADWFPSVSKGQVVWQTAERGSFNIKYKNLTSGEEMLITTERARQWLPRISGDIIVWIDERDGQWDIFGYSLTEHKLMKISESKANDAWPDVSGRIVVYVSYPVNEKPYIEYVLVS
jgi:beta propeller repeat protein